MSVSLPVCVVLSPPAAVLDHSSLYLWCCRHESAATLPCFTDREIGHYYVGSGSSAVWEPALETWDTEQPFCNTIANCPTTV